MPLLEPGKLVVLLQEPKSLTTYNSRKLQLRTRQELEKSDIASGKFIRDDPTGMKEKTANRELKTLEDGIKNARLGLEGKTPDGRPLYNEQGDVVSTKFSKEDLKTFSPMMY